MFKFYFFLLMHFTFVFLSYSQDKEWLCNPSSGESLFLRSAELYKGEAEWKIKKFSDVNDSGEIISARGYKTINWLPAVVPGTVLTTLVHNEIYPDLYYGDNNRKSKNLVPDISDAGREFYHYWYRTEFNLDPSLKGKNIWLKFHGINYICEVWLNGKKLGNIGGMFNAKGFNITGAADFKNKNVIAVNVLPVEYPGTTKMKDSRPGAKGENQNGGDGMIGKNVTMLMSAGWDFTAYDGIRDRNTGIWRDVEIYATGDVILEDPFIKTKLPLPDTTSSSQTVSVSVNNISGKKQNIKVTGEIPENFVSFEKLVSLNPYEKKEIIFTPEEYSQLIFKNPRLWWPVNKGEQNLYTLKLFVFNTDSTMLHSISCRFGIREITSDQHTPDSSRRFLVNGYPVFIRGTNWIPEAMLKNTEERTLTELLYTKQSGLNFIRLWGGGIAESDYFYELCDRFGILVWTEFWITGDTEFPADTVMYLNNVESTVKRIRNHPSLAYYVSSNESTEIPAAAALIKKLDDTRGYQMQSECCGIHDGSPYKYENPMQYFENTASKRGSRVDGFNPEYGTPCLPVVESLKEMMDEKDLWPVNDSVWNYLDGGGFHQVTTKYTEAVNQFGVSSSIEEFAKKAQFVGAMNYRSIWEVWNYNKFNYGDRFASGFLFWYHNSPLPQVGARMYDYSLEPTAALYYSQDALEPLHPQFDYLKNTVSVYNDYRRAFYKYRITAKVYDINSKQVLETMAGVNIPADGVANDIFRIDFPKDISDVCFVKLILEDSEGKEVADAFYWRSSDKYEGPWTMTGPAVSGFNSLNSLPPVKLAQNVSSEKDGGVFIIKAEVSNPGTTLSFFTRIKIQDENGKQVKPAFYSDNFFNLLPGEKKDVEIKIPLDNLKTGKINFILEGWNAVNQNTLIEIK